MNFKISQIMDTLDSEYLDNLLDPQPTNLNKTSLTTIKRRVRRGLKQIETKKFNKVELKYQMAAIMLIALIFIISVPAIAEKKLFLKQPELITDTNRSLIGKETTDGFYIICRDGKYLDSKGNELSESDLSSRIISNIPDNRIVKQINDDIFIPSSIVEFETKEENGNFISPEIITINGSLSIFTKKDGQGWDLKSGDTISFTFKKYKSEVVANQSLLIGYIKDGTLMEADSFTSLDGTYQHTIDDAGNYYIYLINASSDSISLYQGTLKINK
jgi:hypothetical protein